MEHLGGQILGLSPRDWEVLAGTKAG
jgi:hypothetical protein